MSVVRVEKNKNYTTMCNEHLKDVELSLKAKGLLSIMLSLPDEWHYSVKGLKNICKESVNAINSVLQELENSGYLIRRRIYCDGRISEWEYLIFENRESKDLYLQNEDVENVDIENVDIQNKDVYKYTKQSNTKELNTNKRKKYNKEISEIIDYLNEKAGKHFKHTVVDTKKSISARLDDGYTVDDFKTVIDLKVKEWGKDKEMSKYLRPSTLFRPTNFENYLNQERGISNGTDFKLPSNITSL